MLSTVNSIVYSFSSSLPRRCKNPSLNPSIILNISDKLDEEDYKEVKRMTMEQIEQLEQEIQHIVSESKELDIKTKIENALDSMENIVNLYQKGDLLIKRTIGCLIFPQKVEFDGKSFQTPKMNIGAQYIYQYNIGLT